MSKTRTSSVKSFDTIHSVQRPDLVTLVTESIRKRILDGSYTAGDVMPAEAELAKAFEVSRNVMREALRNLRILGLVEVTQGRRPRVSDISTEASVNAFGTLLSRCEGNLEKLMAARAPLEVQVVSLLAKAAQAPDLTKAVKTSHDMNKSDDYQSWSHADLAFHRCLANATGNEILVTIIEAVTDLTFKLRENALSLTGFPDFPQYRERSRVEHNRVLDAIERRDEEAARNAMNEHMGGVVSTFRSIEEKYKSSFVPDGKVVR